MSTDTEIPADLAARLTSALAQGDQEETTRSVHALLAAGIDPLALIDRVIVPALTAVGERFERFEIFLPELMMAGEAAEKATTILEESMAQAGTAVSTRETILLGTVQGDVHDIGKNILKTLLTAQGYRVIDLGRDVTPDRFLEEAAAHRPDLIGLSALMTTTMPAQKWTLDLLAETGVRDRYKVAVGGGSVTQAWADEIGADGFAPDAGSAVRMIRQLLASSPH